MNSNSKCDLCSCNAPEMQLKFNIFVSGLEFTFSFGKSQKQVLSYKLSFAHIFVRFAYSFASSQDLRVLITFLYSTNKQILFTFFRHLNYLQLNFNPACIMYVQTYTDEIKTHLCSLIIARSYSSGHTKTPNNVYRLAISKKNCNERFDIGWISLR